MSGTGSSLTLKNWNAVSIVENLARSTTATVGGTQTVHLNTGVVGGCSGAAADITATATFMGVVEL